MFSPNYHFALLALVLSWAKMGQDSGSDDDYMSDKFLNAPYVALDLI